METSHYLKKAGLAQNEVKVYLSLLKIGRTTTSKIIKDVGINTSKVYESLERLLKKGLVSYTIIKNKKNWVAEDPEKINSFLEEEKLKIEKIQKESTEIIEELKSITKKDFEESEYKIYEGIRGIKTARENALKILKKGETFHLILSSFSGENRLEAYFEDFQKRRAKKGIKYRAIFNNKLKRIIEKRGNQRNSEVKFANPLFLSPTWTEIYGDTVAIGVMSSNPSMFVIKNKDVAKGFLGYFEGLWKTAKK